MTPRELPRLARTLRHLRREQWIGQLRERLVPRRIAPLPDAPPELRLAAPCVPFPGPAPHVGLEPPARIRLLNRELDAGAGFDWDFAGHGRLFAYHLHHFEWLRMPCGPELRARAILDWSERHRAGVGWDPEPIGLRSLAWLKLLATPGALPSDAALRARIGRSLAQQLDTLAGRLETHLLANHYLFNLLALATAGHAFEGAAPARWRARAAPLASELAEQVGPDGAHYERSPMYHSLALERVLDLVNVLRARPDAARADLLDALAACAARMLRALRVLVHPDGQIALLGDSAFGIAQPPAALESYAAALGIAAAADEPAGVLRDAGFVRLAAGPFVLIASVGGPRPSYQPGHAHCDALSFELSVAGGRVVTDTGVYEYVEGARREASRATRSHATLEIDGQEQAEVWGAHRVGGRPAVALRALEPGRRAEASLRGWSRPRIEVRRAFEVENGEVRLVDEVTGATRSVRLTLPLAPGVSGTLERGAARLATSGGRALRLELPAGVAWRLERSPYYPEFGRDGERSALIGEAPRLARAVWRLRVLS